jgi:DNA primase
VKEEPKLWREAVKGAVSVYRYYIDWAMKAFDVTTGEGIKRISQEVAPVLAKIENTVERAYYVKMLAGKLGVTEAVVEEEVRRVGVGQVASVEKEGGESLGKRRDRRELLERYVVSLLVHTRRGFGERLGSLEAEWFVNGYVKKVVERLRGKYLNAERVDLTKVRSGLPAEMLGLLQELYMEDQGLFDMSEEAMEMLWRRSMEGLKEMYLKERLGGVSRLMSSEEVSVEETKTLRDEYRKLMGQLKRN